MPLLLGVLIPTVVYGYLYIAPGISSIWTDAFGPSTSTLAGIRFLCLAGSLLFVTFLSAAGGLIGAGMNRIPRIRFGFQTTVSPIDRKTNR